MLLDLFEELPPFPLVAPALPEPVDFDDVVDVEAVPAFAMVSPAFKIYSGIVTVFLDVIRTF